MEGSIDNVAPPPIANDLTLPSSSDAGDEFPPPIPGLLQGRHGTSIEYRNSQLTGHKVVSSNKAPSRGATLPDIDPISTSDTSRPPTPLAGHILSGSTRPKSTSRRAKKAAAISTNPSSGDEASRRKPKAVKAASKKLRKWDADGYADEDDGITLDYSATSTGLDGDENVASNGAATVVEDIKAESFGIRTGKGEFVPKDLDNEVHSILQGAKAKKLQDLISTSGVVGSSISAISGLFRNIVGGKVLTKADLEKPMKGMEEHLLKKNIAREAAVRLCEAVERELVGVKTGSFESQYTVNLFLYVTLMPPKA